MKLYYFKCHGFGKEAYVMAESKEKAIQALLSEKINESDLMVIEFNASVDRMLDESIYTIYEKEAGEVIWGLVC